METRIKIREIIAGLDAEQRQILNEELLAIDAAARPRVALEEITAGKMSDPQFAARVREEINAAIRGEI